VTGPGLVKFTWRQFAAPSSSVEPPSFRVNGSTLRTLSAVDDWIEESVYVPAGQHQISWTNKTGKWGLPTSQVGAEDEMVTAELREQSFQPDGLIEQVSMPGEAVRWSSAFPNATADSDIVINPDQVVLMDEPEVDIRSLMIHGQLLFADTDVHLSTNWLHVMGPSAKLQIGTQEQPVNANIRITLTDPRYVYRELVDLDRELTGSTKGQIRWHVDADGNRTAKWGFGNYKGLMVMDGGTLSIYSASALKRSHTQLAEAAKPGDFSLVVEDSTGWAAGDRIALAPTGYVASEAEEFILSYVDGNTLGLTEPVQYEHSSLIENYIDATGNSRALDMRAEVGLLSRNVVIEGDEKSKDVNYGAHSMFMYPSTVNLSGVEFRNCGQQGSQGRYCVHWHRPYIDNMKAIYTNPEFLEIWDRSWENNRRDPELPTTNAERWDWYMANGNGNQVYAAASAEDRLALDRFLIDSVNATGDYIRNSSIHNSFQRAVNLHGVNGVVVDNNVGFNISNHAFVHAEDGGEFGNTMSRNLAILVTTVRDPAKMAFLKHRVVLPDDLTNARSACFESKTNVAGSTSSCQEEDKAGAFWGENPFNTVTDNVAAGVRGRGNGYFYSSAVVTRTFWDKERGLYLMSGRNVIGDGKDRPVDAPAPAIFINNRAHTISMENEEPELGSGDSNIYPPQLTGTGFFLRAVTNGHSVRGPGIFEIRDLQGYGFQDHGIWMETDMQVDGCVMAASYKRLVITHGSGDDVGIRNCVLVGETTNPQLVTGRDSGQSSDYKQYIAFGPNYGRSSDDFHPFIEDTIVYQHRYQVEFLDPDSKYRKGRPLTYSNVQWAE